MRTLLSIAVAALLLAPAARAQEVRISELTQGESAVPVRLVGYGLVVGLDNTGDRGGSGRSGGHTVQSVSNLLQRFDIHVPAEVLRTRNVAAVLVTAEVSPYLRPGGRFEIHVSSVGDARSLRGGVLWMTPLVADAGGTPVATAQGPLLLSEAGVTRGGYAVETTARLPTGGLLEQALPRTSFASDSRLLLRQPDLETAIRIADAINGALGAGAATVEDPGSIALRPAAEGQGAAMLARIGQLRVSPDRIPRLIIDGRDGTVVAGGGMTVGPAVVSHSGITLSVGAADTPGNGAPAPAGSVRVPAGTSVQEVATALHAVQTPAVEIAAIFAALHEVGALSAEVVIR